MIAKERKKAIQSFLPQFSAESLTEGLRPIRFNSIRKPVAASIFAWRPILTVWLQ